MSWAARAAGLFAAGVLACLVANHLGLTSLAQGGDGRYPSQSHHSIRAALQKRDPLKNPPPRVVLLTGAAGFVGFHTALELHRSGDAVIGLDNFNSYYDVRLKRRRAELLAEAAHTAPALDLFEGDVCDGRLLRLLLREGRVTNVIHLAAQAGVKNEAACMYTNMYMYMNVFM